MTRTENWTVEPDGKGAFNAAFEMLNDGKVHARGNALEGVTEAEAEAHCAMARRHNAERDEKMALVKDLFSKANWTQATGKLVTADSAFAGRVYDALAFFCGGAELVVNKNATFTVKSRGYYHYVGA